MGLLDRLAAKRCPLWYSRNYRKGVMGMGHEKSVISGTFMQELGEYSKAAPLPLWVVHALGSRFQTLGLYARIASAASLENDEKMRVTVSKGWATALLGETGAHYPDMSALLKIGAITKVAEYASGKVRFQIETYPPAVREEMDAYRRPDGRLVANFS